MHKGTSEWSVQGLGSTAAALVEAGERMGRKVVLVEEAESGLSRDGEEDEGVCVGGEEVEDHGGLEEIYGLNDDSELESGIRVGQEQRQQSGIFHKRLPMLNGSSKTDANDVEAGTWSGRTVEVGIVLKRWFRFANEEMLL